MKKSEALLPVFYVFMTYSDEAVILLEDRGSFKEVIWSPGLDILSARVFQQ